MITKIKMFRYKIRDKKENLNGIYRKKVVYYAQTDPKWANFSYKPCEKMKNGGCAPTVMAMVLSTLKNKYILPMETAEYAMKNGYVVLTGTMDSYFEGISSLYNIHHKKYGRRGLNEVKKALANGNKLAVAWMREGTFTTEGHYLLLIGIETVDSENYFIVYDPSAPNENYKEGVDGVINYKHSEKRVIVKAKTSIFAKEAITYHIFDDNI